MTAREEIQAIIDELTPDYVSEDYLRTVESMLEEIEREFGPHPLLSAAIKKISARIVFLEIGEN
jgi:hypothetical protein